MFDEVLERASETPKVSRPRSDQVDRHDWVCRDESMFMHSGKHGKVTFNAATIAESAWSWGQIAPGEEA